MDQFHKFPRTSHIFDLGSVTRDDLHLDSKMVQRFLTEEITIEEKIDGANLGISLGSNGAFVCQNRAKIITSASHSQFKTLDKFLEENSKDLYKLLTYGGDQWILFGEYMYAKHGIHYTNLPSYFVAFDMYSISSGKFYSRIEFTEAVGSTSIPMIRTIFKGVVHSKDALVALLDSESGYYGGKPEGLYIRLDSEPWLEHRCKLVSPSFQQEIDEFGHWSRKILVKNQLGF